MCIEVLNGMADTIAELERKLAEREWIPCSERLPQKREEVIYSLDSDIVSTGFMDDRDCNGEKAELHWKDLESRVIIEPQAWMPLPKPYREESEA